MDQNWNTDRSKCTSKYSSALNENFKTVLATNPPGVFLHQGV